MSDHTGNWIMPKQRGKAALLMGMAAALAWVLSPPSARAYVEIPYTMGRIINEATQIVVMRVERVDKTKNLILYRKVQDLKGAAAPDVIKHNIGQAGFHPREWQTIMAWAEPGKTAVFFNNGGASETCIDNYWYQAYSGGEWWNMSHSEPYFLRSFAGRPEKLVTAVTAMIAGQEVVIPCMMDGDKNAIQLRTAKIQRLKASLKIQDYDAKRDFVGWGGEDFRTIAGMPGFEKYAGVTRSDPDAGGIAATDFDGDGKVDLCLYGAGRVSLLQNGGNALNEIGLAGVIGARAADWGDYNGDGKPDLLLATPAGPKLYTNLGEGKFSDDSGAVPREGYYHLTAAAWLDYDGDKRPDILLANGYLGLRLYRNKGPTGSPADATPKFGKWQYIGPFDNTGGKGFDTAYPPESEIDPAKQYDGRNGEKAVWKEGNFADGQVHNLKLFKGENHTHSAVYLYRRIDCAAAVEVPATFGSDDGLAVWLNGEKLISENTARAAAPDQNRAVLRLKAGPNHLLLKVCQGDGDWAFYFKPGEFQKVVPLMFEDVSERVGLGPQGVGGDLKGDHLAVADVNGDGRSDFLYSAGNGLLALNTSKGFVAEKNAGITYKAGKVTPVFGDFDGDKAMDLFVPQAGTCRLFRNDGKGRFTDVTAKSGALAQSLGNATCATWTDLRKKGRPDLLVGCLSGPNRFFRNAGNGTFAEATAEMGLQGKVFNSRGVCAADLNQDGALDVVFNNEGQESAVLLGRKADEVAASR